jgi:anti-sigma B factor antagonist
MNYRIEDPGTGVIHVFIEGNLNFAENEAFQALLEKLIASRARQVVLNLAGLSAIDSVGLGLLYIALEDLSAVKTRLTLASAQGSVARLLELTEAHRTFDIQP